MAKSQPGKPSQGRMRHGVKGPLVFSAVLGVVAGFATTIFATGGAGRALRVDLGLTAAGIAFIVSLMICAMLMMVEAPNPEHLGKGSGVNRSSAPSQGQRGTQGPGGSSVPGSTGSGPDDAEPRYGQRRPDA